MYSKNLKMDKINAALLLIIFTCFLGKAQSRYTCTCESQKGQFYSGENINACFHATDFVDTLLFPTKIKQEGSGSQVINTAQITNMLGPMPLPVTAKEQLYSLAPKRMKRVLKVATCT